jgi:pantothenate kinase type III
MKSNQPHVLIVVDVGNSGAKLAVVRGDDVGEPVRLPRIDAGAVRDAAIEALGEGRATIAVSGSDPPAIARLLAEIDTLDLAPAVEVGPDHPGLPVARVDQPERAGVDRRAQVLAAATLAGGPAAVVSCGTAITVDLGNERGELLGGAILPGLGLGARALATGTASLPQVTLAGTVRMPGLNTEDAIRAGLRLGAAGAIERLLREAQRPEIPVFLTGQDACHLEPLLAVPVRHYPGLGLYGIAVAVRRGRAR